MKMNIRKLALAALMMALGFSSLANAAKNDPKTAYIFGFASSFNDSTVYITGVQKVDSAYFVGKANFLVSRDNYSFQLRDYLEQQGAGYRTCAVIYDLNQKKVEKKWMKLYSKYTRKPKAQRLKSGEKPKDLPTPWLVKTIDNAEFHFVGVAPTSFEEPKTKAEIKAEKQQAKAEAKKHKADLKKQKQKIKQANAELKKAKAEAKWEKKMQEKMQKAKK